MFPPSSANRTDPDAAIRSTDDDAAQSRLSAVRKGYLIDPFIHLLVPRAHIAPARPPLINIGTYLRARTIDALVYNFIEHWPEGGVQVVSLGAGSDTRFWRLNVGPLKSKLAKYVEVDFPEVTTKKAMTIHKHAVLRDALGPELRVEKGGTQLSASAYHLLPADLRHGQDQLFGALAAILSTEQPLLVLAECVFPYMTSTDSGSLLRWFSSTFDDVGVVVYEMFGLHDSFGKVMHTNLQSRGVQLPGVAEFHSLDSQRQRFLEHGFNAAIATTLKDIRTTHVSQDEAERLSRLELLDELEELDLVLDHYAVMFGLKCVEPWSLNLEGPDLWSRASIDFDKRTPDRG